MAGRPKGPKTARPSITMPVDLWKRLKGHARQLRAQGDYASISAVVARAVREFLDEEDKKARR
jgi:Arc/MetJ-type ribon-helix-helix transcriptional regulator